MMKYVVGVVGVVITPFCPGHNLKVVHIDAGGYTPIL